mmetsp:Transcript_3411/g.7992  ORF Transcript_3411/g.7992 Transcript_3411/m.7992 type:complete len:471 (-) Transcript_3411:238-1650(-)
MPPPSDSLGDVPIHSILALGLCYALDAADWTILPGMFKSFEEDFGVTLSDIGIMYLMQCMVASFALPIWGLLGDRLSRKHLLEGGCFAWGVLTLMCGLSQNFTQFILFRSSASFFMALVSPITQSIIADSVSSGSRGRLFGHVALLGTVGGFVGQVSSTVVSGRTYHSIRGWRWCFFAVGLLSVLFPMFIHWMMVEPVRSKRPRQSMLLDWKSFNSITFWVLTAQGIFGSIPWRAFGMYSILYLEMIGFSPLETAVLTGSSMLSSALGQLIAGYLGDALHRWRPYAGRLYASQASVAIGIVLNYVIYALLPHSVQSTGGPLSVFIMYFGCMNLFSILGTWCGNATDKPAIADISPAWARASIYSFFMAMQNIPASLAGYLVSFLAEGVFGYHKGGDKDDNISALSQSLLWMMLVPWTTTLILYTTLHLTYKKDAEKSGLRLKNSKEKRVSNDDENDLEVTKTLLDGHKRA